MPMLSSFDYNSPFPSLMWILSWQSCFHGKGWKKKNPGREHTLCQTYEAAIVQFMLLHNVWFCTISNRSSYAYKISVSRNFQLYAVYTECLLQIGQMTPQSIGCHLVFLSVTIQTVIFRGRCGLANNTHPTSLCIRILSLDVGTKMLLFLLNVNSSNLVQGD